MRRAKTGLSTKPSSSIGRNRLTCQTIWASGHPFGSSTREVQIKKNLLNLRTLMELPVI